MTWHQVGKVTPVVCCSGVFLESSGIRGGLDQPRRQISILHLLLFFFSFFSSSFSLPPLFYTIMGVVPLRSRVILLGAMIPLGVGESRSTLTYEKKWGG